MSENSLFAAVIAAICDLKEKRGSDYRGDALEQGRKWPITLNSMDPQVQ